jgi:hypothetical protein
MILSNPVTLIVNNEQIEISNLDIFIMDHQSRKIAIARVAPFIQPIILWRGLEYDNVGDYTQAQVEQRILERLGDNTQETLQSLVTQA